jgi:hypothetical protein
MYFKYASQVEQWYYYSIGSAGSTPPFYELFMAIVIFDVLIGIRISNKKGFLGAAESFFERGKKALEFAMAPVASIIMLIIYLIFTLLNIRLATAIFIIFLYVHSYFGMQLYAGSISDGYKEMTKMIYDALNSEGKECTSNGTLEQLSRRVLKYIYDNLVVFIFCTILFSGIFAYNDNMKSAGKNTFVMINVMILICIVLFKVVYAFLDKSEVGNIGDYDMPKL